MKHRNAIAAIATATALTGTCAVVPAASASTCPPKTHTLTFTLIQEAVHNYLQTISSQQDKDVNQAGKVVGYDRLHRGTGAFKGAAGTIVAKNLNPSGSKTAVTIAYHT